VIGEIKPHSGSLKDGRLDLVYYQNPGLQNPTLSLTHYTHVPIRE
jgi:hypothetical protein